MGIWELVSSKAEAVKRNAPDAKNACRSSYSLSSAAFAKIRTIAPRRWTPAHDISAALAKEVESDRGLQDASSMKNGRTNSCGYGYGFFTFAKIGYTVRVKGIYRVVQWMKNDGTESIHGIYATNFARNTGLRESKDIVEFIPDQAFAMPMKEEFMNSYTFGFITFFRIGHVVRVNVFRFGHWMADDDTKSRMSMYSTILARNARRYALQNCYKMVHGGVGVVLFLILSNTLIDIICEHKKLWKEKATSDLRDEAGFLSAMKEFLISVVNGFISFMMEEPFLTQFFCKGVFTMQALFFFVRELLVFAMIRCFGTQTSQMKEMVDAIMRAVFGTGFANDFEFHERKGGRKKKGNQISW